MHREKPSLRGIFQVYTSSVFFLNQAFMCPSIQPSYYSGHLNLIPTLSSSSLTSRPSWSPSRYLNMVSTSALFSSMSLCWLCSPVFSTLGWISSSMLFSLLYSDMVHALPTRKKQQHRHGRKDSGLTLITKAEAIGL